MARKDVIQVRVSEEEKKQIAQFATRSGISVSDWMRTRSLHLEQTSMPPRALETAPGGVAQRPERPVVSGEVAGSSPAVPVSPRAPEPEPRCTCFDRGRQPGDDPKCYFHGKRSAGLPTIR